MQVLHLVTVALASAAVLGACELAKHTSRRTEHASRAMRTPSCCSTAGAVPPMPPRATK
jgi:hypothetical protein